MRIIPIWIVSCMVILVSCSKETTETITLTAPGFGVTATEIAGDGTETDLAVFLRSSDPVKGIQFTLRWDDTLGQVGQPVLTSANPGFTVSTNAAPGGRMKVLIFSMQGDVLDLSDPEIFHIPVQITNPAASQFTLNFENAVFAGPGAASYEIPVQHAKLRIAE